ncbi:cyclic nucleotide-binding domain-containing protein [Macromonas nakdongensis]|uniref:cyclic nucleotide-binding domain-containing protein n=1 Tax=Macromonas nakdongensis TaxID=1843082 RepID=UPI000C32D61F|nr:cyclic nucleotide-binding domain-containing protein [Macromonas nakdongensis]
MNTTDHSLPFDLSRGGKPPSTELATQPFVGAAAALSVSIPHALGLGLVAFSPLAQQLPASTLALWSAAVPGALMTLWARGRGVVYAPSTAVALLFGGMMALVVQAGQAHGIGAGQALAITGLFAALGFFMQWLMARLGLAKLARFIPVSVTQGFSAGVGLSLVLGQLHGLLEASGYRWGDVLLWQAAVALAVTVLSVVLQRLWPRFPTLLLAVALVALASHLVVPSATLAMAAPATGFVLPVFPDWWGAPWWAVLDQYGFQLASLSLLMAVVNALEVTVFYQQLETEHGLRSPLERVLGREALIGMACAALGMIPASSSTSRSRTALSYTRAPTLRAGQWHALGLLLVAGTGHWWLNQVPMAVLMSALLVAGGRMVPRTMWSLQPGGLRKAAHVESWVVAWVFVGSSGAMALLAGLAVATVELLRASGSHAVRRMHLEGRLRSRHVRRAQIERWLAPRMRHVAVFELQGIVSFGVAALVVDQVRQHLQGQRCVILDASRVPSWDETGCLRLQALAHELHALGVAFVLCGVRGRAAAFMADLHLHQDLDRALEWAEDQLLQQCPPDVLLADPPMLVLDELGADMPSEARLALEAQIDLRTYPPGATILRQGERDRSLLLVQSGTVTLSTAEPPSTGMRLSVIGAGAVFGEMAFLNGIARTAYAHAGAAGTTVGTLDWERFQAWRQQHPEGAHAFITALAKMGIRRLGATSQELRAAME